ncbi:MAG: hypothetical protein CSB19_00125 [Clostridiales bacterium]|nr:MAG: hypothetical protein CSB19_00125 [Clostridiales bacterium]
MRVNNYEELKDLVADLKLDVQLRELAGNASGDVHEILVGLGENSIENGSCKVLEKFLQVFSDKGIKNVRVIRHGDFGKLHKPTVVQVNEADKESVTYVDVDEAFVEKIVEHHFIKGEPLGERRFEL